MFESSLATDLMCSLSAIPALGEESSLKIACLVTEELEGQTESLMITKPSSETQLREWYVSFA